jgi:hypothetical protein
VKAELPDVAVGVPVTVPVWRDPDRGTFVASPTDRFVLVSLEPGVGLEPTTYPLTRLLVLIDICLYQHRWSHVPSACATSRARTAAGSYHR